MRQVLSFASRSGWESQALPAYCPRQVLLTADAHFAIGRRSGHDRGDDEPLEFWQATPLKVNSQMRSRRVTRLCEHHDLTMERHSYARIIGPNKGTRPQVALLGLLVALPFVCPSSRASTSPTITQNELIQRTQRLLDAYAPGDRGPFRLYVADDAMFFDDDNDMDKAVLLESIRPLPSGYSGSIRIERPKVRFAPSVAVLAFDAIETETVFGEVLHARYHMTHTWLFRKGQWQIVAGETHRYYEDPAAGHIAAAKLADYVGTYQLAPGVVIEITQSDNQVYAQRGSQKPYRLVPESSDVFFRQGVEGRKLFHRDASNHVDLLIDRRNNEDLFWKRISR